MGFVGDWIIFSFKLLVSALISGAMGWQQQKHDDSTDLRAYVLTGALSSMLVMASAGSSTESNDFMLGFVITGILVAIAILSSMMVKAQSYSSGVFSGIKLLYSASLGILVGAGEIIEAVIAAVLGYLVLNHLKLGSTSPDEGKSSKPD